MAAVVLAPDLDVVVVVPVVLMVVLVGNGMIAVGYAAFVEGIVIFEHVVALDEVVGVVLLL